LLSGPPEQTNRRISKNQINGGRKRGLLYFASMSLKQTLRRQAQALGIYEGIAVALAKVKGYAAGIRIARTVHGDFCLRHRRSGRKMFLNKKHAVYLPEFIDYFDFYFEGVVPDANNEVHYEEPAIHTPRRWGRPLYFTSFAESEEVMDLYLKHGEVKPDDVIFDLGAYCGLTALGFGAQVGKNGQVYTFEPDPGNFAALERNVKTAEFANITAENAAIWKESGYIELQAEGTAASMVLALAPRTDSTVRVKSFTLEEYVAAKGISRIDCIKLDVEGSEVEILNSSRTVLRKFKPIVMVEAHMVRDVLTAAACKTLLEEEGYQTYEVTQPGTTCPLIIGKAAK
jgi:FkbM family methyltransferase